MLRALRLIGLMAAIGFAPLTGCTPHTVVANAPGSYGQPRGLTVTGVGEAKATPDVARTNIGVEIRAESVEQATVQSNQRMDAIIAAMRKLGIADRDLRSHSFSISFEQIPEQPPQPLPVEPQPRGKASATAAPAAPAAPATPLVRGFYRASNMLEVTIRDLSKAGQVLQAATDAGANNVWGITFELEDDKPLLAKARAEAVADAKRNAQALAEHAGIELGPIVAVNEGGSQGGPVPMYSKMANMEAMRADVPIERGEITVTQQIQLVYELP
jgi:uncharacterized protein